jgi:hypothetical protein
MMSADRCVALTAVVIGRESLFNTQAIPTCSRVNVEHTFDNCLSAKEGAIPFGYQFFVVYSSEQQSTVED